MFLLIHARQRCIYTSFPWKHKDVTHPKDPLLPDKGVSVPGPEEDVRLSAGDDGVWIGGVKVHRQNNLIGGLSEPHTAVRTQKMPHKAWTGICDEDTHLDLCNLGLLLPVPNGQHVVVAVIDHTQVLTGVLRRDENLVTDRTATEHFP